MRSGENLEIFDVKKYGNANFYLRTPEDDR